jgi:hypothetical protein
MKTIFSVLLIALFIASANAAVLHVGHGVMAPYSDVQPAINAASAGDTITIAPSAYPYGGFIVDRRLTIIGAGYDTTAGRATVVGAVTIVASRSTLASVWVKGAARCYGCWASGVMYLAGDTITVTDCLIENDAEYGVNNLAVGSIVNSGVRSALFRRCAFWMPNGPDGAGISLGYGAGGNCDAQVNACVFVRCDQGIIADDGAQLSVDHCVFDLTGASAYGVYGDGYFTITNSACIGRAITNSSWHNPRFSFCASAVEVPPGQGNILLNGGEFVNIIPNDPLHSDYHLSPGSPLINAGDPMSYNDRDGSRADIGIYGGQNPYRPLGIPIYPFILSLDLQPLNVPQNGVLEIMSTGRVGGN